MSIGKHQSAKMKNDEWLTPPDIIKSLGTFDLDPCSPINRPWPTAENHFSILDNGLLKEWFGRVWLNPPYSTQLAAWMNRMSMHNRGTALTFARTDTNVFHDYVFPVADSIFFVRQRITFLDVNGVPAKHNGGAPSVLIAYSEKDSEALRNVNLKGYHQSLGQNILILWDRSWKLVIQSAIIRINRHAEVPEIYDMVEKVFPEKVKRNPHYKEKIRQVLRRHFTRVKRGAYKIS